MDIMDNMDLMDIMDGFSPIIYTPYTPGTRLVKYKIRPQHTRGALLFFYNI